MVQFWAETSLEYILNGTSNKERALEGYCFQIHYRCQNWGTLKTRDSRYFLIWRGWVGWQHHRVTRWLWLAAKWYKYRNVFLQLFREKHGSSYSRRQAEEKIRGSADTGPSLHPAGTGHGETREKWCNYCPVRLPVRSAASTQLVAFTS